MYCFSFQGDESSFDFPFIPACRISYLDIFKVVELTCQEHQKELVASPSLEEIIHYDLWARQYAASLQTASSV